MAPGPTTRRRSRLRTVAIVIALGALGGLAVIGGHSFARSAVVDLGPTDAAYVRGFRDIERDGEIYFRWSSVPSSSLDLPTGFCGPGSVGLRVRRHFLDPAILSVSMAGTVIGQRAVQAGEESPYEVITFQVSKIPCGSHTEVLLESIVNNTRPLGVAVDWLEIKSNQGFWPAPASTLRGALAVGMVAVMVLLAGGRLVPAAASGIALSVLIGVGLSNDLLAGERILRGATPALFLTLAAGASILRFSGTRPLSVRSRFALVTLTLGVLISRSIFLHPKAFYPDYRVHELVLQTLQSSGLRGFLDQLFEIQYARSLGLQQIDGNWYPFPYPPGSYLLAQAVSGLFDLNPLEALLAMGVAASSLIPVLTVVLGMLLGLGETATLAGAFFVAFQPLLIRRLALGYFPGVIGQVADALSLLLFIIVAKRARADRWQMACLGVALLGSFLIYTQSIANFGLLVAGFLVVELLWRRPGGLATASRIALVSGLALGAAAGAFYWRYLPVLENVSRQLPQPEASTLDRLDALRRANPGATGVEVEDPSEAAFTGPTLDPVRGLARLGSRLWRFNGIYAIGILIGGWMLWRDSGVGATSRNLVLAWGSVCLWISLLASGLPGPNGFQHLKDLEFVSPLLALSLGVLFARLWVKAAAVAAVFGAGWVAYAGRSYAVEVVDRLVHLADR